MLADTFEQLTELRRTLGELDGATMRRFAGIEMREDDLSQQIALLRGDGNGEYGLTSADEKHLASEFGPRQHCACFARQQL